MQRAAAAAALASSSSSFTLASRRFATEVDAAVKMVADLHRMHVDNQQAMRAEGRLFREEVKGLLKELKADHKALRVQMKADHKSLSKELDAMSKKLDAMSKNLSRLHNFMRWCMGLIAVNGAVATWYTIWPQ